MSDEMFRPDWRILGALVRLAPSTSKHDIDAVRVTVTEKDVTYDVTDGHAAIRVCVDGGGDPFVGAYPTTEIRWYVASAGRTVMEIRGAKTFPDIDVIMPTEPGKALPGRFKARLLSLVTSIIAEVSDIMGEVDVSVSMESGATTKDAYTLRAGGKRFWLTALVMPVRT